MASPKCIVARRSNGTVRHIKINGSMRAPTEVSRPKELLEAVNYAFAGREISLSRSDKIVRDIRDHFVASARRLRFVEDQMTGDVDPDRLNIWVGPATSGKKHPIRNIFFG